MCNDIMSDMLTRLRNASLAKHHVVEVPATTMTRKVASILVEEGFIKEFEEFATSFTVKLLLSLKYKFKNRCSVMTTLKRVSKPGLRVYANRKNLPKVLGGLGVAIISTSQGIMTDSKARHYGLGGEVLCYIW